VIVANSLDEMSTLIKQDEVDLYIDSPFPILAIQASTGGVPFMRRWKKGISEYSSVIFVRKDSGIHSLDDLQGKIVAFEEEFSTSGYFLPKASLINSGFELIERLRKHDPVPRNKVGFVFSRDDETTMIWVLRNKVAAGALNKSAFFLLSKSKLNDLRVIKETIKVPRQVVVHRANLPETLRRQISTALLDMHNNAEGRKVLENFSTTKKFELLNVNELTEINKLFHLVDTNVEF
jgi:phosphonate transport system substrate-binding protein